MEAHLAEILARESACLADVADGAQLSDWRRRLVEELMSPCSPYALALRSTADALDRVAFLDQWRRLLEEALERVLRSTASPDTTVAETAVSILAALHGGSTLSQVAQDRWPLNAALDMALAPFTAPEGDGADRGDQ